MKLPRAITFAGAAAALVIIAVVATVLLVPWLIDSRQVKDKISSELLERTYGSVTFDKITFLWFPRPTFVIENTEISLEDNTRASIRNVRIYPSIYHLLTGRLIVRRALLHEPRITYRVPQHPGTPLDLEAWEEQIRSVLVRLTEKSPASDIQLSDGSAEISIGDQPPMLLKDVAAHTIASPERVRFTIS
ncbi:MAG TPA: hypothetical protein VEO92_03420, partial [Candidatus Nitrosocosmicus sp.]|nr:hypothetical protein [Candidatus Nitrosocosmicus sp.]